MPGLFEQPTGQPAAPEKKFGVGFQGIPYQEFDSEIFNKIILPEVIGQGKKRKSNEDFDAWLRTSGLDPDAAYWAKMMHDQPEVGRQMFADHQQKEAFKWQQRQAEEGRTRVALAERQKAEAKQADDARKAGIQQQVREQMQGGAGSMAPGMLSKGRAFQAPGARDINVDIGAMTGGRFGEAANGPVATGMVQPRIWTQEQMKTFIKAGGTREDVPDVMLDTEYGQQQGKASAEKAKQEKEEWKRLEKDKKVLDEEGRRSAALATIARVYGQNDARVKDAAARIDAGEKPTAVLKDVLKKREEEQKGSTAVNEKVHQQVVEGEKKLASLRRKVRAMEENPEYPGSKHKPNAGYNKWKTKLAELKLELEDAQSEHNDNYGDWRPKRKSGQKGIEEAPRASWEGAPSGGGMGEPGGNASQPPSPSGITATGSAFAGTAPPNPSAPMGPNQPMPTPKPGAMDLTGDQLRELSGQSDQQLESMGDDELAALQKYTEGEAKKPKDQFKTVVAHFETLPPEQGVLAAHALIEHVNKQGLDLPEDQMKKIRAMDEKLKQANPALYEAIVAQFHRKEEDGDIFDKTRRSLPREDSRVWDPAMMGR